MDCAAKLLAIRISFLISCLTLSSCAVGRIDEKVIVKFSNDDKSFAIYQDLCQINGNEDSNASLDLYIKLYNQGVPLVRLFEYETIIESFNGQTCENPRLNTNYLKLVSKKMNYISDERKEEYFKEFIKNYTIIPATN